MYLERILKAIKCCWLFCALLFMKRKDITQTKIIKYLLHVKYYFLHCPNIFLLGENK